MAAPLRSANTAPANDIQFTHFGILDTGKQSRASTVTSLVANCVAACVIVILSAAATRQTIEHNKHVTELVMPITEKKPDLPKPKIIPPKIKPIQTKVEPPKIKLPDIKIPEPPKTVKMETPKPVIIAAAPKQVVAMAAPQVVHLGQPKAASIPNSDAHPSPVRLGLTDSPIKDLHGPAVSKVVLGGGVPGMSASNTGSGPPAAKVSLGSGQPDGKAVRGGGAVAVVGIPHGVPGGTGTGPGNGQVTQVNMGHNEPPPMPKPAQEATETLKVKAPKVIYKPKPEYTAEARQLHLEGLVSVRIRVMPNGQVEVLGITNGLGHGLDESAKRAVLATKFEPATDASGHPVTWDGVVNVAFQLAG
ncbi:MAG TPA: energy transducer TonB [Acidobacteriaceae bacterium]|jgi:TonB family protein|nr:energy transducer TonB [Acidobacteriaceae bacterium]